MEPGNRGGTPEVDGGASPTKSTTTGSPDVLYGALPEDIGLIDLAPAEMMFWLYCPIKTPESLTTLPPNLRQFQPIIDRIMDREPDRYADEYVYLTAKTLWVTPGNPGNRPGWHSDGFGSNDLNFVWYDGAPTEFIEDRFTLPDDCADAMAAMAERADRLPIVTYPDKHLLRLTPAVIHRVPTDFAPGLRTFVKVSISPDRYNLVGNSINHGLGETWPLLPRRSERNHPHDTAERYDLSS
jgi:hypothetical protein